MKKKSQKGNGYGPCNNNGLGSSGSSFSSW